MRGTVLIWIVSMASMFTFLSVFWWALQRRREREAYYRYELARHLIERAQGTDQAQFLAWLKEQDRLEDRRRRQGLLLGALVLIATGLGVIVGMEDLAREESIMGYIPLFIGLAMLLYLGTTSDRKSP